MQPSPIILAIDTAMAACSVAIVDGDGQPMVRLSETMGRGQSERLAPMIGEALAQAGLAPRDLGLIAVTVGPGAFTGLRIGISAARAFATALRLPITGIVTLDAIGAAWHADHADRGVTVVLETKRSDYYARRYFKGQAQGEPAAVNASLLAGMLQSRDAIVGDGARRFATERPEWQSAVISGYEVADPLIVARLGLRQSLGNNLQPATPLYLREADISHAKTRPRMIESS